MNDISIRIKVFPALNGESILVESLDKMFLIDGGYVNTFNDYLHKELKEKAKQGKSISHLIVTHIDSDHISGIVKLLEKNIDNKIIAINNVWHNSYRHIKKFENEIGLNNFKGVDNLACLSGKSYLKEIIEGKQEVSAEQGSALGALILNGTYKWNNEFSGKAVSIDNKDIVRVDEKTFIRILSPNTKKLSNLKRMWNKELYKKGFSILKDDYNYDDAFEFLIAQEKEKKVIIEKNISNGEINIEELSQIDFSEDTSVANGSSISFVIESYGKKLLFLADSHPSLILESLKKHYSKENFPIYFDIIKLSHHGSISNTSTELLEFIDSDNFIISTNGSKFGHPNIETIARVVNRKSNFVRRLNFNYQLKIINDINKPSLKDKYSFEIFFPDKKSPLEIIV